jgi:hypothetical protein
MTVMDSVAANALFKGLSQEGRLSEEAAHWRQAAAAGDEGAANNLRLLRMQRVPLTIAGRSPLDRTRLKYAGAGCLLLGFFAFTGGAVGIVFGVVLVAIGIAIWALTSFGRKSWYELPRQQQYIVGAGATVGFVFVWMVLAIAMLIFKAIDLATGR